MHAGQAGRLAALLDKSFLLLYSCFKQILLNIWNKIISVNLCIVILKFEYQIEYKKKLADTLKY